MARVNDARACGALSRLEHLQLYPSTLPARDCILGAAPRSCAGPSVCRGAPRCVLSARFRFSVPARSPFARAPLPSRVLALARMIVYGSRRLRPRHVALRSARHKPFFNNLWMQMKEGKVR